MGLYSLACKGCSGGSCVNAPSCSIGTSSSCAPGYICGTPGMGCQLYDGVACSSCLQCCGCPDSHWSCTCFAAGTRVLTPDGKKPIEQIRSGDKVFSVDTVTHELLPTVVVGTTSHVAPAFLRVTFANGVVLEVTAEHPFWDSRLKVYRKIGDFMVGIRSCFGKEIR